MALAQQHCEACRADAPRVTDEELARLLAQIPEWSAPVREGILQLERQFRFSNFSEALAFTQRIGALAEQENHHPSLTTEWGKVTVVWWTHKIRGLHKNDFIMAARTDTVFNRK